MQLTMRRAALLSTAFLTFAAPLAGAAPVTFAAVLDGASEATPNNSPGNGHARVTFDVDAHTMLVNATFAGLLAGNTAAHIHCCTAAAGTGTIGVATTTPTFTGFPTGATGCHTRARSTARRTSTSTRPCSRPARSGFTRAVGAPNAVPMKSNGTGSRSGIARRWRGALRSAPREAGPPDCGTGRRSWAQPQGLTRASYVTHAKRNEAPSGASLDHRRKSRRSDVQTRQSVTARARRR